MVVIWPLCLTWSGRCSHGTGVTSLRNAGVTKFRPGFSRLSMQNHGLKNKPKVSHNRVTWNLLIGEWDIFINLAPLILILHRGVSSLITVILFCSSHRDKLWLVEYH